MAYEILNPGKVQAFVDGNATLKAMFGDEPLEITEIGDGNLNFVYILKNPKHSAILKQAVPYLRCAGESWPLSRDRMTYEIRATQTFEGLAPALVPALYFADEAMSVMVMRYLDRHVIMRKGLIEAIRYPRFAEDITDFLSQSLFKTSSLYLGSAKKRKLMDAFNQNTELCKLTEDFVFTFPYMDHDSNSINPAMLPYQKVLQQDTLFKTNMLKLKYIFMNRSDALLHGDLHTGSIMLNANETHVIDPEFAFIGPFGFDIGALIANLIQSYVSHFERSMDEDYQLWLLETVREIYEKFEAKFLALWNETEESALFELGYATASVKREFQKHFLCELFKESVGFAGAKMVRRLFGIAGVEDIDGIEDEDRRSVVEKKSLAIGKRLVREYETITSVDMLINIIKSEAAL